MATKRNSYVLKRIEDCAPGDILDMGVFAGIDPRQRGQGPNTVNVRLEGGLHYTESAGARVRVWKRDFKRVYVTFGRLK